MTTGPAKRLLRSRPTAATSRTLLRHPVDEERVVGNAAGRRSRHEERTGGAGGEWRSARVVDPATNAKLEVSFFRPFWGHRVEGTRLSVASCHPGANSNLLTPGDLVDAPSGNAVMNGIPVTVTPAEARSARG